MRSWFRQGQGSGDNSRQIQAARDVYINEGVKPDEVVRICTELMRTEFDKFSTTARVVVEPRAQEFLDNYMSRQAQTAPAYANSMEQPRMQRALQSAQIEYATSGEADLGGVLVDLVVDLSQQNARSVYATSIMDAISIAPKLVASQMNALTVVSILRLRTWGWANLQNMYDGLREFILPYIHDLPAGGTD